VTIIKNMKEDYKYTKEMVEFYDTVYENLTPDGDLDFYVQKLVNAGGPALEIGCGTGRIFAKALKLGADIYGIDQSELMLSKLKEKIEPKEYHRVQNVDAREFKSDKKFKLIIAPFRIFQHVLTVDDQLQFLENVKENLEKGGRFIMDVFNPDINLINKGYSETLQFEGEHMPGKKIKRYHRVKPDVLNQFQHVTFRFVWDEGGKEKEAEFYTPMRYYFRYELEHLIARAGLKLVNIHGDFKENALSKDSKSFVVECTKL